MALNWKGNELIKKKNRAVAFGINKVITDCIVQALNNHPGWRYDTGVAETSIRQAKDGFATEKKHVGRWGSIWTQAGQTVISRRTGKEVAVPDGNYVWFLEFNHGSFLRKAANEKYKNLGKEIKNKFKQLMARTK